MATNLAVLIVCLLFLKLKPVISSDCIGVVQHCVCGRPFSPGDTLPNEVQRSVINLKLVVYFVPRLSVLLFVKPSIACSEFVSPYCDFA